MTVVNAVLVVATGPLASGEDLLYGLVEHRR
jgi:hypothetical protein